MSEQTVFNSRFDITGVGILRLVKQLVTNKFLMVGSLFGNPGVKYLVMMVLLHYCGGAIYWALVKWERPLRFLINRLRSIK